MKAKTMVTEKELRQLGFKKKFLTDKSGFWFERPINIAGFKGRLLVENDNDNDLFLIEVQTYDYYLGKLVKANTEIVSRPKCDLKTIKSVVKKFSK